MKDGLFHHITVLKVASDRALGPLLSDAEFLLWRVKRTGLGSEGWLLISTQNGPDLPSLQPSLGPMEGASLIVPLSDFSAFLPVEAIRANRG